MTDYIDRGRGVYDAGDETSGFHIDLFGGPAGIRAAFVARFVIIGVAACFSIAICFIWGALNGWHVTTPMLVTIGSIFAVFVFLGERARVGAFENAGNPRGAYLGISAVRGGLRIGSRTVSDARLIHDNKEWERAYPIVKEVLASKYNRYGKRILDLVGASLALVLVLPIWVVISVLLKLDRRGPLLERVSAVGRGGQAIRLLRFQTGAREGGFWQRKGGGAGFGAFLARSGLARMPELVNVLKGDLSLVGPEPKTFVTEWDEAHLGVKPGMTGLARVAGYQLSGGQRVTIIDRYYVLNLSFPADVRILATGLRLLFSLAR